MPSSRVYERSEVDTFLGDAYRFAKAVEEVLTTKKYGQVPLTQSAMNEDVHKRLQAKEQELTEVLTKIRAGIKRSDELCGTDNSTWLDSLNDAQTKWLGYRNAHCDFITYLNMGGTIRPTIWGSEAISLTENRISDLQTWLEQETERTEIFSSDAEPSDNLRVFDVQRQLLLDERFNTLDRYWAEMTRRAEINFAIERQKAAKQPCAPGSRRAVRR